MSQGGPAGGQPDVAEYLRYMRGRGYARSTINARLAVARDWISHTAGELEGATHRDVERWAASRNLTAGGTRNLLVNLRALYRWARREGFVTVDPTELADRPPIDHRLPRPAPEADIARLYAVGDVRLRAMLALMSCGGLRCVECARLNWGDVDLAQATVIVNGKGGRERLIDLGDDVTKALAALALMTPGRRDGAVFRGAQGARLKPYRVSQIVSRAFRAIGSRTRAHQLRHRCATMALRQPGVDLLAVRDLLGHASVATTQLYTLVSPGRTAAASRALRIPAA